MKKLKVLLSAYACEPGKGSEPEVGWQWALQMARFHDVTVLTRANNRAAIEPALARVPSPHPSFIYFDLPAPFLKLKKWGMPISLFYFLWQISARIFIRKRLAEFDLLHHITFNSFRLPGYWWRCKIPVILGPLGGGQIMPWQMLSLFPKTGASEILRSLMVLATPVMPNMLMSFHCASAILVANTDTWKRLGKHWRPKMKLMLETGVNSSCIQQYTPTRRETVEVAWLSRLDEIKSPVLALRAFEKAWRVEPALRLTLIGDGPLRETVRKNVALLGLQNVVTLPGRIPKERVEKELSKADLFLFTSLRDTSGNVLLEAMAAGLPAVCLRHHGAAEIATDETAIRVEPASLSATIQNLAGALVELARDPARRAALSQAAQQRIEEHFLWPRKAEQMSEIYLQTVEGCRHGRV